ncbi:MAG: hypothetical protein BJ554DRAFT_7297 [Olpidium bornovanus]|uniref:Uncharacterized protein n=1 Tax=Olpidium bornovanus TaxID=278681 RepID=A0A8H8DJD6_9FUNG|nr:MAG: hypothetical protein BJ554DRAFT_7297 [Olpidium bornovanus]
MTIDVRLPRTRLQVLPGREGAFARFMGAAFERVTKRLLVRGDAAARVNTSIGVVRLDGVGVEQAVTIDGMEGLRRLPATIRAMDLTGSEFGAILVHSEIDVYSPASVSASLGAVELDLFYCPGKDEEEEEGGGGGGGAREENAGCARIGFVRSEDMRVVRGWNKVKVDGRVIGSQKRREEFSGRHDPLRKFLGLYMSGVHLNLTVRGSESSSDIPSLAPLLSGLSLEQAVPSLPGDLMTDVRYHVFSASSSFVVNNTFPLPVRLIALRGNATFRGYRVGTFRVDLRDTAAAAAEEPVGLDDDDAFGGNWGGYDGDAFVVPARSARVSPHWKTSVPFSGAGYELVREVLATGGSLLLDVSARCYVGVGEWRGWMEGEWKGIRSTVALDT